MWHPSPTSAAEVLFRAGRPRFAGVKRLATALLVVVPLGLLPLAGCSGDNPFQAAADTAAVDVGSVDAGAVDVTVAGGVGAEDNSFIPEGQSRSDCVGTLPQPNCGGPDRGTRGAYLTMFALLLGVGFIAWRVSIGIRARDKIVNEGTGPQA